MLAPHMLMLSATPIPRTLAMSYLADLDVSVIDELPPGRQPVVTKLVSTRRRDEVIARIRADVAAGRQCYWVCPLIEASDAVEAAAAIDTHARIAAMLPELRVGLLHGQLPSAEKTAMMQQFAARSIDVLVATTVIEVGVDVPNATLMVIEHAERFGLAQLHQLRGRVGRGADAKLLHPALRRAAVGHRARAAEDGLRDQRRLRGRAARPYDAGPGRVSRARGSPACRCCGSPISSATRRWSSRRATPPRCCSSATRRRRASTCGAGTRDETTFWRHDTHA